MTGTLKKLAGKPLSRRDTLLGLGAGASLVAMPWIANAQTAETIRIGFPTPLTGPFGAEAKDQVKSAELAVKLINDKGGIGGRKVELLVRDDKLNAGEAATRTLELIEKDKVHAIVGALSSAVQLAVNEVTRARGVIYVSISQSDTINEVKDFSRFTFHEALNPTMTTAAVAKHTFKKGVESRLSGRRLCLWPRDAPRLQARSSRARRGKRGRDPASLRCSRLLHIHAAPAFDEA